MTAHVHPEITTPPRECGRARLRRRLFAWLSAIDCACILGGFFLAGLIYQPDPSERQWLLIAGVLLPIYLAVAINRRAYTAEVIQPKAGGVIRAFQSFFIAIATLMFVAFYLKTTTAFSRVTFAMGSGFSLLLLAIARETFLSQARSFLRGNPYTVVVIADGTIPLLAEGAGMLLLADAGIDPDVPSPEMYNRLALAVRDADRVIVHCPPERRASWARALQGANVRSEIIVPEIEALAPLAVDRWDDAATLVVADGPLSRSDQIVKRVFDLAVAGTALVLLSPVLIATALVIKFASPGPIFFVQTRVGQGNRHFRLLKFRSMRMENTDANGAKSVSRDDQRVTGFGRFIRATSIDELPQLINVIAGDMSIVGPRPHALGSRAEDRLFWEIDDRYWHRHAAKPGLTGLAQIRGFRGATLRERDLTDRLQADLEYVSDWTVWRDIRIVLTTFRVLVHRNAF